MQSDANRLFERMVFDDNQAIMSAEPEIEYSPIEYSEPQYEAFHAPVENSALSVAVNRAPQPHLSKQTEVNHGTVKPEISSASGWKSPEQKVASHSEKNGSLLSAMFETDQEQPQAASSPFTLPKLNREVDTASAITSSKIESQTNSNEIQDYLISTIAEKTDSSGNDRAVDLEEDLAVDSIRRVEILELFKRIFPTHLLLDLANWEC